MKIYDIFPSFQSSNKVNDSDSDSETESTQEVKTKNNMAEFNLKTHEETNLDNKIESNPIRRSKRIPKPTTNWWENHESLNIMDDYCLLSYDENIPRSYEEAIKSSESNKKKRAMDEEYRSLLQNNTFELVKLPEDKKVIGSRWVYDKKIKNDGTLERFKARYVVKGFSQVSGVDFNLTYSPVASLISIRLLIAISSKFKWNIIYNWI